MMDHGDVTSSFSVKDKCGLCFAWTAVLTWLEPDRGWKAAMCVLGGGYGEAGPVFLGGEAPAEDLRAW